MHATILLIKRQKSCFRMGFKPLKKYVHGTHSGSKSVADISRGRTIGEREQRKKCMRNN